MFHDHRPSAADISQALADRVQEVAEALLGQPNRALSTKHEMRFGNRGSVAVRITGNKRGAYYDHQEGRGGDLLDLVAHTYGVPVGEAIRIARRDFLGDTAPTPAAPPRMAEPDPDKEERAALAVRLWQEAGPTTGTLAERHLIEVRGID